MAYAWYELTDDNLLHAVKCKDVSHYSHAKRTVDDLVKETLVETEDFYVYPPQLILKPFEKRSIKVKWRGDKTPLVEEA